MATATAATPPPFCDSPVPAVAVAPDAHCIVAATDSGKLHVARPPPSIPELHPLALPRSSPSAAVADLQSHCALSFPSPDTLYAADARGTLSCFSVSDAAVTPAWTLPAAHGGTALLAVAAPASAGRGAPVVTAGKDTTVRAWDVATRRCMARLSGHKFEVRCVAAAASSDDSGAPTAVVASGGRDRTVRLWDLRAEAPVHVFDGHSGWVHGVALARPSDAPLLVSCAGDKTVRVWDLRNMALRACLAGHEYRVWALDAARDGRMAVTGSTDATVRAWRLDAQAEDAVVLKGHYDSVLSVAMPADATFIASACSDGNVFVWGSRTLFADAKRTEGVLVDVESNPPTNVVGEDAHTRGLAGASAAPVPRQLDPEPLIATPAGADAAGAVPVAAVPVHAMASSAAAAAATPTIPDGPEHDPRFDKSAAELVSALKRIQELEREVREQAQTLADRDLEVSQLRKKLLDTDSEATRLRSKLEASSKLVEAANVRALLLESPRKADVSKDYQRSVNKIGAVSDQLTALAARLDAMIATN